VLEGDLITGVFGHEKAAEGAEGKLRGKCDLFEGVLGTEIIGLLGFGYIFCRAIGGGGGSWRRLA